MWEGVGDRTKTAIYWLPLLWPSALCFPRSPGLLNRRPRGPALCWMMAFFTASYQQLVSKTPSGVPMAPSGGCGFPYHILSLTHLISNSIGGPEGPFSLVWLSLPHLVSNSLIANCLTSELYNSSTSTQSPTQSLEWHVWSSSSGNNCHAVQRSLSSGASVYECIMGFYLTPFRQPNPPTRFLSIPLECVTSFRCITLEWHVWPGRKSIYNTSTIRKVMNCYIYPSYRLNSVTAETKLDDFYHKGFFGLLSSSLLLFPQRFGRYVLRPSSGVCRTREPSQNFELRPLLNPRGSHVLIPLAITGYKC